MFNSERYGGIWTYKPWVRELQVQHRCKDNGYGLADFAGVRVENVQET
jgi:hypothetical protein